MAPGDWNGAIDVLAAGVTRRVDVARIETREETFHFVNIAGAGFIVDAGRAALRLKWLGQGAYTLGTLLALARLRSHRLRVEIDGEVLQHDSIFVEVSNTRYTGTHFLIAPGAVPDDGLLDVTICRALPRGRLLLLFPTVFTGRHVHYPEISVLRGRHIRLETPAGLPLMIDGEFRGRLPAEIRCLPRDLEFFSAPCS
jgi:diacylglycerol kinase (ATP)